MLLGRPQACSPIQLPLDGFEPVDLSLDDPLTETVVQRPGHGGDVPPGTLDEANGLNTPCELPSRVLCRCGESLVLDIPSPRHLVQTFRRYVPRPLFIVPKVIILIDSACEAVEDNCHGIAVDAALAHSGCTERVDT